METKKMVMIPGPTPVVKSIQDQMGREIQAFGDPRFVADYKKLIEDLGKLLNCSGQTFPLAGRARWPWKWRFPIPQSGAITC